MAEVTSAPIDNVQVGSSLPDGEQQPSNSKVMATSLDDVIAAYIKEKQHENRETTSQEPASPRLAQKFKRDTVIETPATDNRYKSIDDADAARASPGSPSPANARGSSPMPYSPDNVHNEASLELESYNPNANAATFPESNGFEEEPQNLPSKKSQPVQQESQASYYGTAKEGPASSPPIIKQPQVEETAEEATEADPPEGHSGDTPADDLLSSQPTTATDTVDAQAVKLEDTDEGGIPSAQDTEALIVRQQQSSPRTEAEHTFMDDDEVEFSETAKAQKSLKRKITTAEPELELELEEPASKKVKPSDPTAEISTPIATPARRGRPRKSTSVSAKATTSPVPTSSKRGMCHCVRT